MRALPRVTSPKFNLLLLLVASCWNLGSLSAQTYPFTLPAQVTAAVNIQTGTNAPLSEKLVSVNIDWSPSIHLRQGYNHPEAQEFMRRYNPPSLRWPQGVWANFYDWEVDGRRRYDDYNNQEYTDQIENNQVLQYGFEGFKELHDDLDFDILWTFNLNYDTNLKSVRRLRDREAKGFDITHVELGNEQFWLNQRSTRIATPELYTAVAQSLSDTLKSVKPGIKLGIPVSWRRGQNGSNIDHTTYNNILTADPTYFDALSVHRYVHLDRGADVVSQDAYRGILTAASVLQEDVDYCRGLAPGKPVWLSEWGVSCGYQAASYLGMADAYLHIFENTDVYEYTNWFQIQGYNTFFFLDNAGGEVTREKTGFGAVHEILLDVFLGGDLLDTEMTTTELIPGSNAVIARAATKNGATSIFAVNKTDQSVVLDLATDGVAYGAFFRHDAMAFSSLSEDRRFTYEENPLTNVKTGSGVLTLPPYSINRIDLLDELPAGMGQAPFQGTIMLPGTIEVENFDAGGDQVAYFDATATNTGTSTYRAGEAVDLDDVTGGNHALTGTETGEWLEYSVSIPQAGTYDFDFIYTAAQAGAVGVQLIDELTPFNNFSLTPTANVSVYETATKTNVELPAGDFILRINVDAGGFQLDRIDVSLSQTAYSGTNFIPGVLQAEEFDLGGQNKSYFDKSAGNGGNADFRTTEDVDLSTAAVGIVVSGNEFGEWQEFTVNVSAAANYNFDFTYAGAGNGRMTVERMGFGLIVTGIDLPATGDFATFGVATEEDVFLPAGEHVLRFKVTSGGFNLDKVAIFENIAQGPYADMITVPGTLEAEDYDVGGPGRSFFDTSPGNSNDFYRTDDVDVAQAGDRIVIGNTANDEWTEYTVNVAASDYYAVDFVYASGRGPRAGMPDGGGLIGLELPDVNARALPLIESFLLGRTASWGTYDTVRYDSLQLMAGEQVLRVNVVDRAFNLDKIIFSEYPASLPVSWLSFTGRTSGKAVVLDWKTGEERDNAGFTVRRSRDGRNWSSIGWVAANAAGSYDFVDEEPHTGSNFYRLEQRDVDGTTSLSAVVEVRAGEVLSAALFPNPATDRIDFVYPGTVSTIRVLNLSGQVLSETSADVRTVSISGLPVGAYFLQLEGSAGVENLRFVKK